MTFIRTIFVRIFSANICCDTLLKPPQWEFYWGNMIFCRNMETDPLIVTVISSCLSSASIQVFIVHPCHKVQLLIAYHFTLHEWWTELNTLKLSIRVIGISAKLYHFSFGKWYIFLLIAAWCSVIDWKNVIGQKHYCFYLVIRWSFPLQNNPKNRDQS